MAGEFRHSAKSGSLSESDYESNTEHSVDSQARGDILISNTGATGFIRLAKSGTTGAVLAAGANDPGYITQVLATTSGLQVDGDIDQNDGGTVTQITSLSTGVTLNNRTGAITTVSATLAAGAADAFIVTNSTVGANDAVICHVATYAGTGTPIAVVQTVAGGSFTIRIENQHTADALNAVIVIRFMVFGGSNT